MRQLFVFLCLIAVISAKERFEESMIFQYFSESNPFYYETIARQKRLENRDLYHLGDLDYESFAKYDYKEYPASEGEFYNIGIKKPLETGIDLSLSYRKAEGVQEYNNIKTGDEGEVLLGVNIPLVSVLKGTNQRQLNIDTATLQKEILEYQSKDNLRHLYFNVLMEYAKVLYYKSITRLQEELLQKAKERMKLIESKITAGSLPKISLVEAKQQVINREQSLLNSLNDYTASMESFTQYLDISRSTFEELYDLIDINTMDFDTLVLDTLLDEASEYRYDLKQYDIKIQQLLLQQKQTGLLNLPQVDLSMYGVHDFKYDEGYKISLDLSFPLERRKYDAKNLENKQHILENEMAREKILIAIKTRLRNIVNACDTYLQNLSSSHEEIDLLEQLEKAENTKYRLGSSNLFILNQREMLTLKVKKKALYYKYRLYLLHKEAQRETGTL